MLNNDGKTFDYNIRMEPNTTSQSVINTALLPNFLFLSVLVLTLGILWYYLEYKR